MWGEEKRSGEKGGGPPRWGAEPNFRSWLFYVKEKRGKKEKRGGESFVIKSLEEIHPCRKRGKRNERKEGRKLQGIKKKSLMKRKYVRSL